MRRKRQCPFCGSVRMRKIGFHETPKGVRQQRWECKNCRRITVKPKVVSK